MHHKTKGKSFLLAAMTFVVYLNKKGLIESLIYRFLPQQISERKLLFFIALFAFAFSSLADNITATLISIALILSLKLETKKTIRFATVVVFAVNSGGVAMITGDVNEKSDSETRESESDRRDCHTVRAIHPWNQIWFGTGRHYSAPVDLELTEFL